MPSHPGTEIPFHVGDACQNLVEDEAPTGGALSARATTRSSEAESAAMDAHRATLKVPGGKPPYGVDADGNPIEPPLGGIPIDPETGALMHPQQWAEATAAPAARATPKEASPKEASPKEASPKEASPAPSSSPRSAEPKG